MNTPDPQAMVSAWMSHWSQLPQAGSDLQAAPWQNWFNAATAPASSAPAAHPLAEVLNQTGARIEPAVIAQLQQDYMQEFSSLWQDFLNSKVPALSDKRFSTSAWQSNVLHAYNAATYLLNAKFLTTMSEAVEAPPKVKQKINFAVQQMVDAMSPANFLATNPEAQEKVIETKGESLSKGVANMIADMQKGRISLTNEDAFEVGRNVATSEGAVVFENELFQLLQYKPLTDTVHAHPLLIVPPCINKFYILDLQPENSLVRYAVEQGHTVFLMSWRNADESLSNATWDQYVDDGTIKAINVVREITGQKQINALGFCVGGTILSTALAILSARGESPVSSLTLLTTLLDFTDTGILDVYIDEAQLRLREQAIGKGGLMPGKELATTFSSLRANDLVWNYVQSNYLKGQEPPPFDLLYWNSDSTNLPGPMFCWYLRNTYLENKLKVPGQLMIAGEKIDLRTINTPAFIYGSREDHIVPWTAAYASVQVLNPDHPELNRFVLGASGHIAGVINPPSKNKRSYWTNDLAANPDKWLEGATEHKGSWWTEWAAFLSQHAGKKVKAPARLGKKAYPPIEPAPGRYVKVRSN